MRLFVGGHLSPVRGEGERPALRWRQTTFVVGGAFRGEGEGEEEEEEEEAGRSREREGEMGGRPGRPRPVEVGVRRRSDVRTTDGHISLSPILFGPALGPCRPAPSLSAFL